MADTKKPNGGDEDQLEDSGLGNLPPLSDFDSQSGFGGEGESLPPISGFDSGGLPPLSDLESDTPVPRKDSGRQMDFDSGPTAIDTPAPSRRGPGTGFQDIAADSDFSPETPEIGPGPDSNVDTPMFDSAFGGGDQDFGMSGQTPAPTQAMETPMFGDQGGFGGGFGGGGGAGGGGFGFDENAFNAGGTPAPDFSPDTDMRRPGSGFAPGPVAAAPPPKKRGGAGAILAAAIIALLIGIIAAPFVAPYLGFLPNPMVQQIEEKDQQIASLNQNVSSLQRQVSELTAMQPTDGGIEVSPERQQELITSISELTRESEALGAQVETQRENLRLVEEDLATKSEEYALAQQAYEDLQNETAIIQARQRGLASEVERLTGLVGGLEEANTVRLASKEALEHNVDRLVVQVREALPLTPDKYSREARIAAVEAFRNKVADAGWVTPELLQEYTSLYLKELEIGEQEEYFFAKMPVIDQFGNETTKWAEALMLGNRAVYYRTLDGKNIGMYGNSGTDASPRWIVQEITDDTLRSGIESRIFEARVPGFEEKVQYLAERELSDQEGTAFSRAFSSL